MKYSHEFPIGLKSHEETMPVTTIRLSIANARRRYPSDATRQNQLLEAKATHAVAIATAAWALRLLYVLLLLQFGQT
jgi:hypothetical protein